MGNASPISAQAQVECAVQILQNLPRGRRVFLFVNFSATHQPNHLWTPGASRDSTQTMGDALSYVDSQLPPLFEALRRRAPSLCVLCGDHGTAYGEDGYQGHRLAHPVVWTVPYAEFVLPELLR
jgi:phosphopentomutase